MRVPLRLKVSLLWIAVTGVLAWLLGFTLYLTSRQLFNEHFLADKLAIARTIARSIDGNVHAGFATPESAEDPEYQRCLRYLNGVKAADPYITYLYTVNIDGKTGGLSYDRRRRDPRSRHRLHREQHLRGVVLLRCGGNAGGRGRRGVPPRRLPPGNH